MNFIYSFIKNKRNIKEENKNKEMILNHYLQSIIRYEKNINDFCKIKSPYFLPIYINHQLFNLLTKINNINISLHENDSFLEYKHIILKFILNNHLNYDDFETSFLKYFKINNDDYDIMKIFVKPFYKDKLKNKNILKILTHIFLFTIVYIQFYMIIHEFLEINDKDLEYYIYLFIKDKNNKEKIHLIQKEVKYEYFHFYINLLFKIFYLTIHLLKDITNITYNFDIHNIFELKKVFLQKNLFQK